jgi:hypothetical protein
MTIPPGTCGLCGKQLSGAELELHPHVAGLGWCVCWGCELFIQVNNPDMLVYPNPEWPIEEEEDEDGQT